MTFGEEFLDMMSDTFTATPGYLDEYGGFVASGALLTPPCRVEGGVKMVRDFTGREVVSSCRLIVGGVYDLTVDRHRYTLPARFSPAGPLTALNVVKATDEVGPSHEVVYLP